MTELKCPFCQQELVAWMGRDDLDFRVCDNPTCNAGIRGHIATIDLWQELIRTRKALDVALDWLKQVATPEKCDDELCCEFTKRKLAEIESITKKDWK